MESISSKIVLALYASSDSILIENLVSRFMVEMKSSEIRAFYSFQNTMLQYNGFLLVTQTTASLWGSMRIGGTESSLLLSESCPFGEIIFPRYFPMTSLLA